MEPKIIEKKEMKLVGVVYYGKLKEEGWVNTNAIGQTWQRFGKITKKVWDLIKEKVVDEKTEYEIHLWNDEEFKESERFKVFVGTEVENFDKIPIEMDCLVLPAAKYASFTAKGKAIHSTQTDKVMPKEKYPRKNIRGEQWEMQVYDQRWKGEDIENSELDYLVPLE